MSSGIAIIGDADTVTGFRLGGITEGRVVESTDDFEDAVKDLLDNDYSILIVTENVANESRAFIEKITGTSALPMIIEIPDKSGPSGADDPMNDLIKRVIGVEMVK